jgi:hypothetical protein
MGACPYESIVSRQRDSRAGTDCRALADFARFGGNHLEVTMACQATGKSGRFTSRMAGRATARSTAAVVKAAT